MKKVLDKISKEIILPIFMKDRLLVFSEFPQSFITKTSIGVDIGYNESAKLAKFLLEDIVNAASQVCNVTIVTSHEDAEKFNQDRKYSQWNVYESEKGLIHQLSDSLKDKYSNKARKVIAISGDVVVKRGEIESWFEDLNKYDSLIGPSIGSSDFRYLDFQLMHPFYMISFDKQFGRYFTENLSSTPSFADFAYAYFKGVLKFGLPKRAQQKRHINTIHDLSASIPLMEPGTTKEFAESLKQTYRSTHYGK